jgi:hypothetical protein
VWAFLSSSTIYALMLVCWVILFIIKALRIKRKKGKLSQKHFAETLIQSFSISTLFGLLMTNLDYFVSMILSQEPLVATESLVYSSLAFGIMDLLLVIYFFYYPLPR